MRRHLLVFAAFATATLGVRSAAGGVSAPVQGLPLGTCRDPIAGVWRVRQYSANNGDWHLRTLHIRRVDGSTTALAGEIETEVWSGGEAQSEPGPCTPGEFHYAGTMPSATGRFDDPRFSFGATTWHIDALHCGADGRGAGYNPDHFDGTLDRAREELRTVNNDGGRSVDEPTVFRRVKCLDPPLPETPAWTPPPTPKAAPATSGCGCG